MKFQAFHVISEEFYVKIPNLFYPMPVSLEQLGTYLYFINENQVGFDQLAED